MSDIVSFQLFQQALGYVEVIPILSTSDHKLGSDQTGETFSSLDIWPIQSISFVS